MIDLKEHNQKTYQHLLEMLQTEDRVACVQPTGTGKSYIALKYIEEHPEQKILLLAPTDIILQQFRETVGKEQESEFFQNTAMAKYLDLGLEGFQSIFDVQWDVIIMDEFHRVGADTWSKYVQTLLERNPQTKIIGLSATPIRFLDDYRNMGEEVFQNHYAGYITLKQALEREILPIPKYVCTDYKFTEQVSDYIRDKYKYVKTKEQEKQIVRRFLENGSGLHEILQKNLPNSKGKYIVFCQDSNQIEKMRPMLRAWLMPFNAKIHIYTTLANEAEPDQPFLDFKNDTSDAIKLLFCVNRLNEGLHLSDLDGEFMLRGTLSPIIYFQQIGRVLTSSQKQIPVIFDLANNFRSVSSTIRRNVGNDDQEHTAAFGQERGSYASYLGKEFDEMIQFSFFDQARKFNELVDELDLDVREENWEEMYKLLKEYFSEFHAFPRQKETYKGKKLGHWLSIQICLYNKGVLKKEREKKLLSIGFVFPEPFSYGKWKKMYLCLKEFKVKYNRLPKVNEAYKGYEIGKWLRNQEVYYTQKKLNNEQINMLEDLGVHFDNREKQWFLKYELLKEYVKKFGVKPSYNCVYKNINLGRWFYKQMMHYKKNNMPENRRELFASIPELFMTSNEYRWIQMLSLLKEYVDKFGKFPNWDTIYKTKKLGLWYYRQISYFNKGLLSKDHQIKLEKIGVVFDKEKKKKNKE